MSHIVKREAPGDIGFRRYMFPEAKFRHFPSCYALAKMLAFSAISPGETSVAAFESPSIRHFIGFRSQDGSPLEQRAALLRGEAGVSCYCAHSNDVELSPRETHAAARGSPHFLELCSALAN